MCLTSLLPKHTWHLPVSVLPPLSSQLLLCYSASFSPLSLPPLSLLLHPLAQHPVYIYGSINSFLGCHLDNAFNVHSVIQDYRLF